MAILLSLPAVANAQAPAPKPRFGITDNSFLVEEAFNQDPGVFQNIFMVTRSTDRRWDGAFTQEWPVRSLRHQFSYTLPASMVSGDAAMGDILLNYRFQLWTEGKLPAFSPRVSVILPSSEERRTRVGSDPGWQFNLPFSRAFGRLYLHGNAGATWIKDRVESNARPAEWTNIPSWAASANWAITPMFQAMFETYGQSASQIDAVRENIVIVSPGFRTGWNFGDRQVVVGLAVPFTRGDVHDKGAIVYGSLEMPFRKRR
ncbi:MAG TPA: transporter [Vicinamibacterales bacterium]|nr:transporter [Vicinamibacterales bacterium]